MDCATARQQLAQAQTALNSAHQDQYAAHEKVADCRHEQNAASYEVQGKQSELTAAQDALNDWSESTTGGEHQDRGPLERAVELAQAALNDAQNQLNTANKNLSNATAAAGGADTYYNDCVSDRDRCQSEVNNCH